MDRLIESKGPFDDDTIAAARCVIAFCSERYAPPHLVQSGYYSETCLIWDEDPSVELEISSKSINFYRIGSPATPIDEFADMPLEKFPTRLPELLDRAIGQMPSS